MAAPGWLDPVTLEGRLVRLEPLSRGHLDGLVQVALDPTLWQWTIARPTDREGVTAWLDTALGNRDAGTEQPFATVWRPTGDVIGSTRYLNLAPEHRRLEIGWTWLATDWQRSGANREAKLLMLVHAFERLGCLRVEFKTDSNNARSRHALLGIGAEFEGIFRKHMVMPDGRTRHSAWYSITDEEWATVKARLTASLEGHAATAPR